MKTPILLSWSGGKDSAMSLYTLQLSRQYTVIALLTTVNQDYDRISMHGVRRSLLEQQAAALGLSVTPVYLSARSSNEEYEAQMEIGLRNVQADGIETVAFGDIFLIDLRAYRERNLARIGMSGLFPIWKRDTRELAQTFISLGFKAVITCVDTQALDEAFAGRLFDESFVRDLPDGVDPCGENGEFHSFVFAGPIFKQPLAISIGEKVLRENRFCFCDVLSHER
jgi:uncharacterized protein (TIGR00290 family)